MPRRLPRREFLQRTAATAPALWLANREAVIGDPAPNVPTATIERGDLRAVFRDNAQSPRVLSGLASLINTRDAPMFDAFDPDSPGASAGLNFEHVISGQQSPHNAFTPRSGPCGLTLSSDGASATLTRRHEDDPWALASTLTYRLVAPNYIDVDFRCVAHDAALFGPRGYAILFFANYMNDVENVALNFRGIKGPSEPESWIAADAPPGHADWNQGGTYRHVDAGDLSYDANLEFRLNSWSYDYPRFTAPFYYGRAAHGMTLILMFDKSHNPRDEVRFSLFKFKVPRFPRPAWDFQYVIHRVETGREYGFRARLAWKKFVSPDDCLAEYEAWHKGLR